MTHHLNPIVFAGAGPGDPELVTIKTMKVLQQADLILYAGSLVPEAVLCWKGKSAQTLSSAGMDLGQIVEAMAEAHSRGLRVVRLHTGDPALYGAILEQMRQLTQKGISYQVIPGVSAAFAASAKMNMEYTLPEVTQTLILTRISGRTPVPEAETLEKLAAHKASMAIYLSIAHIARVQQVLVDHYGKDALCAVAYKVSHPEEKILYARADQLEKTCQEHGITRHALILAGKAVAASVGSKEGGSSKLYDAGFSHGYRQQSQ